MAKKAPKDWPQSAIDNQIEKQREIEQFLGANLRGGPMKVPFPPAAIDDLRYFARAAAEGRKIRTDALAKWMKDKHGIIAGRTRLHSEAVAAGLEPWWSSR